VRLIISAVINEYVELQVLRSNEEYRAELRQHVEREIRADDASTKETNIVGTVLAVSRAEPDKI
jgi:inner membrane protein involved in colicin E2 resistance